MEKLPLPQIAVNEAADPAEEKRRAPEFPPGPLIVLLNSKFLRR
jgi:hypothetical protein